MSPCEPLVRSPLSVCTGPESAFLMRTRCCALTAAFQADANVNSFQQMPPGKASMNVVQLELEYTSDEKCRTSLGSEKILVRWLAMVYSVSTSA